jgi:glutamine synthetase
MLGSSQSIAGPNIALNTIMAEELGKFADELEQSEDFEAALQKLVCRTFTEHQRIIFNGNGYSHEWEEEANKRGLLNLKTTPEALFHYSDEKNIRLFDRYGIYTPEEVCAREDILLENYCRLVNIEALTMVDMANKEIIPSCIKFMSRLSTAIVNKKAIGVTSKTESDLLEKVTVLTDKAYEANLALTEIIPVAKKTTDFKVASKIYLEKVIPAMENLRKLCDTLEVVIPKSYWPLPTYSDMLFSV